MSQSLVPSLAQQLCGRSPQPRQGRSKPSQLPQGQRFLGANGGVLGLLTEEGMREHDEENRHEQLEGHPAAASRPGPVARRHGGHDRGERGHGIERSPPRGGGSIHVSSQARFRSCGQLLSADPTCFLIARPGGPPPPSWSPGAAPPTRPNQTCDNAGGCRNGGRQARCPLTGGCRGFARAIAGWPPLRGIGGIRERPRSSWPGSRRDKSCQHHREATMQKVVSSASENRASRTLQLNPAMTLIRVYVHRGPASVRSGRISAWQLRGPLAGLAQGDPVRPDALQ